jgi:formate/nitrite transporter FocA (FNT family)
MPTDHISEASELEAYSQKCLRTFYDSISATLLLSLILCIYGTRYSYSVREPRSNSVVTLMVFLIPLANTQRSERLPA